MSLIVIDTTSVYMSRGGRIRGVIGLNLNRSAFPSSDWDDFICTCLSHWLSDIYQVSRESDEGELTFFDGPYFAKCRLEDHNVCQVSLLHNDAVIPNGQIAVSLDSLRHEVLAAAQAVAAHDMVRSGDCDDSRSLLRTLGWAEGREREL